MAFTGWARVFLVAAVMAARLPEVSWAQADAENEDASVDGNVFSLLAAHWWQFVFSIPSTVNPTTDQSGATCMVGQRGDLWFLAGFSGTATCPTP